MTIPFDHKTNHRIVESDYTVVFFAAGGRHTPGWNWVWKAYRSLSRKYRKNLKKLVSDSDSLNHLSGNVDSKRQCSLSVVHCLGYGGHGMHWRGGSV